MQQNLTKRTSFPADKLALPRSSFEMRNSYSATIHPMVGGTFMIQGKLRDTTRDGKVRDYLFEGRWSPDRGPRSTVTAGDPENTNSFDDRDEGTTWRAIKGFGRERKDLQDRANRIIKHIVEQVLLDLAFLEEAFNASRETISIDYKLIKPSKLILGEEEAANFIGPPPLSTTTEVRRSGDWLITRITWATTGKTLHSAKHATA